MGQGRGEAPAEEVGRGGRAGGAGWPRSVLRGAEHRGVMKRAGRLLMGIQGSFCRLVAGGRRRGSV